MTVIAGTICAPNALQLSTDYIQPQLQLATHSFIAVPLVNPTSTGASCLHRIAQASKGHPHPSRHSARNQHALAENGPIHQSYCWQFFPPIFFADTCNPEPTDSLVREHNRYQWLCGCGKYGILSVIQTCCNWMYLALTR